MSRIYSLITIFLFSLATEANPTLKYLGTFNSSGTPDYLEPVNEEVSNDFVQRISAAVPENMPVPDYHPSYLNNDYKADIRMIEDGEIFISFVLEGAGYKNVLGFYTYPTEMPPQTVDDVDTISIIFPNVSRAGSGGELLPGNRVKIGHFKAGTTVAFVVFANGFKNQNVTFGQWQHYSDKQLNPPSDDALKQHSIVLYDNITKRHVISFEDITRPGGDRDFNDAVFFGTTNPPTAALTQNVPGLPVVWEGTVNSAWNDPNNWNPRFVPDSTSSITISADAPNAPYIPEDVQVVELVVEPGATISSDSEVNLTVTGDYTSNSEVLTNLTFAGSGDQTIYGEGTINDLTIESGNTVKVNDPTSVEGNLILTDGDIVTNNNLEIVSSSTANGMILQNGGEINGEITFRRKIPNKTGYHYLSSPIKEATLADINDDFTLMSLGGDLNSSPFPNIYIYDETNTSQDNTQGWTVPSGLEYPMTPGVGFATYINANTEVDVTGTPNNGDIDVALSHTHSGQLPEDWDRCPPDGWNLVGNPYPSAIDWEKVEKTGAIHPGVHMWNPYYNKYATYFNGITINNGSNRIAAFQGFFVRSDSIGDTLRFRNDQRLLDTTETTTFFRTKQRNVFKIAMQMGNDFDETAIYLSPEQFNGFDPYLDNFKIAEKSETSPLIYIQGNKYKFSIKSVDELNVADEIVKIGFYAPKQGEYTITQRQLEWNTTDGNPLLHDKLTGNIVDLDQVDYTFSTDKGTDTERFEIIFRSRVTGTQSAGESNNSVTYQDNRLNLVSSSNIDHVQVNDINGKILYSEALGGASTTWSNRFDLTTGIYFLKVSTEGTIATYKFFAP